MSAIRAVPIASLRLHPDAEKVPMPDASDLRALDASLKENGQQDPIDVTADGVILDGRTRYTLLAQHGATSIQARVVDIPEGQQTAYIIERAVARRHLTMAQKRALNDLMRTQVVEVRPPTPTMVKRGITEPVRIGHSQVERAEKLGVTRETVKNWDAEAVLVGKNLPTREAPTHALDPRGRPQPMTRPRERPDTPRSPLVSSAVARQRRDAPPLLRKTRPIPRWAREVTSWLRNTARPEDKEFLRRLDEMVHAALQANGIACIKEEAKA